MARKRTPEQLTEAMNKLREKISGAKASGENTEEQEQELAALNEQRKAAKQAAQQAAGDHDEGEKADEGEPGRQKGP